MTRYKQYLRKVHNYWLNNDFPFLPYDKGSYCIEDISTAIEDGKIVVRTYYTSITIIDYIDKYGNVEQDYE